MTIAIMTPRRHEEILTHRTNNRKLLEIDCQQPELFCCAESGAVDDHDVNSKNPSHYNFAPSASTAPTMSSSNGQPSPVFAHHHHHQGQRTKPKRRNNKRGSDRGRIFMLRILVGMLIVLICVGFYLLTTQNSEPNPNSGKYLQKPKFERFSSAASTSCAAAISPEEISYTLVTHVSTDRLWMMQHHCQRWQLANESVYPISIAVFTNETMSQIQHQLEKLGCQWDRLQVQIVSARLYPFNHYPINKLRNMALAATRTSHAILIDIDFWITEDLAEILQFPEVTQQLVDDPKATLVIPAFQLERQCHQWRECPELNVPEMPRNLQQLKQQIMDHKVTRFDPTNRGGHGSTRYKEWFRQNYAGGDSLVEIGCFLSNRYEPYIIFRYCKELPPFQEHFAGYGKNKMTWVMQLRRMGYTFWQLGKGAFVIHYPHLDSPSRQAWNVAPSTKKRTTTNWKEYQRGRMDQLFVEFREWLRRAIPDQTRVPFCKDGKLDDDARLWYDRNAFRKSHNNTSSTTTNVAAASDRS